MDDLEELQAQLSRLREFKGIILVEGKRDVAALRRLGIMGVMQLDGPLFEIVEKVAAQTSKCAILTDLDDEGKKLYHELYVHLQRHGVRIDNTFREFLFRTPVRHIEGLDTYVKNQY